MKNNIYLNEEMRMADVLMQNPNLLPIIRRFGITLGFQDKTIQQLCEENLIDVDLFLLILNMFNDSSLNIAEVTDTSMIPNLLNYLKNGHIYYIDEKLPYIYSLIQQFADKSCHNYTVMLIDFFDEYRREVVEHIEFEDATVYPYILELSEGRFDSGEEFKIESYTKHHTDIEEKLDELKMLLIKYFPPTERGGFLRNIIISELFSLEYDLRDHNRLEDEILVPLVKKLEQNG